MENQIDCIGESKAVWVHCGAFPLAEIAKGRRACRSGWRNRGYGHRMIAIVSLEIPDQHLFLIMEREDATEIDQNPNFLFCDVKSMLATDWFLEQEKSKPVCTCPTECDCQNPPPDNGDGTSVYGVSEFCPVHNVYPAPPTDCPVHGEEAE
ncbi:MAG TPA: hypothetical protein VMR73_00555 [Candidatus Paceibacterota bacterium]|nr:hypothetical protein [Candidatus Paceibacterota bacterium]